MLTTEEVDRILRAWSSGDRAAQERLWPTVFQQLKALARRQMARERLDHSLESGGLVNEAYLRLADLKSPQWESSAQFFALCAKVMRNVLVDHARTRQCQKRPNPDSRLSLNDVVLVSQSKGEKILALDEALSRLAEIHPRKSQVVELRFFGGLTVEETADALGISRLTVIRDWNFSRAWLEAVLNGVGMEMGKD